LATEGETEPNRTAARQGAQFIGLIGPVARLTGFSTTSLVASTRGILDSSRPQKLLQIAQVQLCFAEGSRSENTSVPLPPDSIIRNSSNPHSEATLLARLIVSSSKASQ